MTADRHLRRALEALRDAARERLARHPLGHLLQGSRTDLELTLDIPLATGGTASGGAAPPGDFEEAVGRAQQALADELDAALSRLAAFRPGRVFCLRCSSADCEHAGPASSREVFAGYGPSGIPRFLDFGQWLLERRHPRIDWLYRKPPELVTDLASGHQLHVDLLPAFRDQHHDYRIHGQVTAGWFRVQGAARDGGDEVLALTFQVLSSAARKGRQKGRRRLALNVLGAGRRSEDGGVEPLESLYDRLDSIPWTPAVKWSQSVLQSIERSQGRKSATPRHLSQRIEGVLTSIARHLEHSRRSRDRRTVHAQTRHAEGDRPTRMALQDLAGANGGGFLVDERRDTIIVLGDRGRAHVWNAAGKLVTSIRYSPDSIERKKKRGIWRPASTEEIAALRQLTERLSKETSPKSDKL